LTTATAFYSAAAKQGHAAAQNNFVAMYRYCRYDVEFTRNHKEAVRWFRKAAEQCRCHRTGGLWQLGISYTLCQGTHIGYGESRKWSQKAAFQGQVQAQGLLDNNAKLGSKLTSQHTHM
jgi:hypothetical protein